MPIHVDPAGASLHGKIAVVTGGAGSIGSAVVSRLVSEGVRVIAVDQDRAPDPAAAGVNYLRGDVTHPATAQRAVATAEAAFGDMDLTCWNRVLAVNLTGTLLACQAAVPAMRRRGGGAIVDLGAVHSMDSPSEQLAYVVSREAVVALSRHLALALEPFGIRVECLDPGATLDGDGCLEKDVATEVLHLLAPVARRLAGRNPSAAGGLHTPTPA